MLDFDERDLIASAEAVGFNRVQLELRAIIDRQNRQASRIGWEEFWHGRGNPSIPSLEEAVMEALSPKEAERFQRYLRQTVESEPQVARSARAYLWAVR